VVVVETKVVEVVEDLLGSGVLLDLASGIKADHVGGVELARHLERLLESVPLDRLLTLVGEGDDEVDGRVGVVLLVVLLANR
jgi:hypothetical protein